MLVYILHGFKEKFEKGYPSDPPEEKNVMIIYLFTIA